MMDHDEQIASATVGTAYFVNSTHVEPAPPRINKPVPVPSVYQDARGEIHNFCLGNRRINLLYTRQGVKRSGDLHPTTQHDFVFCGLVQVWTLQKDGTTRKTVYAANQYIAIPPYVPHVFEFLEDSVVAEWWDDNQFYAWFYRPYRAIVDASFQTSDKGRFSHYILSSSTPAQSSEASARDDQYAMQVYNTMIMCTGVVVGLIVGYSLGSRRR
jgi:hypothetical protein